MFFYRLSIVLSFVLFTNQFSIRTYDVVSQWLKEDLFEKISSILISTQLTISFREAVWELKKKKMKQQQKKMSKEQVSKHMKPTTFIYPFQCSFFFKHSAYSRFIQLKYQLANKAMGWEKKNIANALNEKKKKRLFEKKKLICSMLRLLIFNNLYLTG